MSAKSEAARKAATAPRRQRANVDWEAVHRDYRTGQFTLRELAEKHGVSHQAIAQRAKKEGWTQDLREQIKQATDAKLVAAVATHVDTLATDSAQATADAVMAAAEANKRVILAHRGDISATREEALELLGELRVQRLMQHEKELLAEILAGEGATVADVVMAKQTVAKALAVGNRVKTLKDLTDALTKLQAAERVAFGLDEKEREDDKTQNPVAAAVAEFVSGIHGARGGRLQHAEARK